MQPGLGLEPLAGEAQVLRERTRVDADLVNAAEGRVARLPDHRACGVRRQHRPADMVDMDRVERAALGDRDRPVAAAGVAADCGDAVVRGLWLVGELGREGVLPGNVDAQAVIVQAEPL